MKSLDRSVVVVRIHLLHRGPGIEFLPYNLKVIVTSFGREVSPLITKRINLELKISLVKIILKVGFYQRYRKSYYIFKWRQVKKL